MKAKEIMTAQPACCTPNARLSEVAQMMIDNDCGEIPVIENKESRKLIGVVTDRDIVVRAVANDRPTDTAVSDIMTASVVSVREDAELQEVCDKMEDRQIRRIPVLDNKGGITGIIAQADIALQTGKADTAQVVKDVSQPMH